MKFRLVYSFIFSTFAAIFFSAFIPFYKPVFYAPFLIISFLSTTFISTLWLCCLGGLVVDVLSSTHMGLNALIYTLLATVLYRQKRYFTDTPINIALFTILLSFLFTILNLIFLFILDKGVKISLISFFTDFIALPFFDGVYAIIFFALPIKAFEIVSRKKLLEND